MGSEEEIEEDPICKYVDHVIQQRLVDGLVKYLQALGTHTILIAEIEDGTIPEGTLRVLIDKWQTEIKKPLPPITSSSIP